MLNMLTFTGADDGTNPADLIMFSRRFPWVEWGILIGSRAMAARMPSPQWIRELLRLKATAGHRVNLSLHICGRPLRTIADGRSIVGEGGEDLRGFERVQLNWHGDRQGDIGGKIAAAFSSMRVQIDWEPEVIFQGDETNAAAELHRETEQMGFNVSMLFDCSHGAGVLPESWPKSIPSIKCGWAGGLGLENIASQLPLIRAAYDAGGSAFDYWIDMETKVRNGRDQFDLAICEKVARIVGVAAPKVLLAFDPVRAFGAMWQDCEARTMWLLWRPGHMVPEGFESMCLQIGAKIRREKPTTVEALISCFPTVSDYWTNRDLQEFAPGALPFFTGAKSIDWEYVPK